MLHLLFAVSIVPVMATARATARRSVPMFPRGFRYAYYNPCVSVRRHGWFIIFVAVVVVVVIGGRGDEGNDRNRGGGHRRACHRHAVRR